MKEPKELPANMRSGSHLIPRGVFKNVPAFPRAATQNAGIEAAIFQAIIFGPLTETDFEPDVIFIICNAQTRNGPTSR